MNTNSWDPLFLAGSKIVNDPIHGHIKHPGYCMKIVDTPQFQRLRRLKQVGCAYFVFPGASHNRFEHCLGVSYLAGKMLQGIQKRQPELGITERELRLVRIAGLCHDLGHGPYSHAFEEWVHRSLKNKDWTHEAMSIDMLAYLIEENNIDISKNDFNFITNMITGDYSKSSHEKRFIFDIVSNSRNSVDVDKFDYLARDSYNIGMKSSYDFTRLLKYCRVINDEICFHSKEAYNVYEMFHTRYTMFKHVYTHRTGKAIEYMIMDALSEANSYLGIAERILSPQGFWNLTDSIVDTIECSREPELKKARAIIANIRKRKLYKLADETLVPPSYKEKLSVKTKDIVGYGTGLLPEDIIVQDLHLNYAMKEKNPVDSVHFYSKWSIEQSFPLPRNKVSMLIPEQFSERYIRVYCRDPERTADVQEAFRKYLKDISLRDYSSICPSRAFNVPPSPTKARQPMKKRMRSAMDS